MLLAAIKRQSYWASQWQTIFIRNQPQDTSAFHRDYFAVIIVFSHSSLLAVPFTSERILLPAGRPRLIVKEMRYNNYNIHSSLMRFTLNRVVFDMRLVLELLAR